MYFRSLGMNSNPSLGPVRQSFQYLRTIMTSASADSKLDAHAHAGAVPRTPRPVVSEVRRSKCGRGNLGSNDGTAGGGQQGSELPLFSPPTRTREEELQRLQLIEGGKKLKKISLREPAAVLNIKDFSHTTHATGIAESSSSGRRHSYSGSRRPRLISTAKRSHHDASSLTNDLRSRRPRSISTANGSDHDESNLANDLGSISRRPRPISTANRSDHDNAESNLTNDLLNLLIAEMARLRSTLESLVEDRAAVEEIRRTNKLLALTLASGRSLEGHDSPRFHPLLAKKIKEKRKSGGIILDSI